MTDTVPPRRGSWLRTIWAGLLSLFQPGLGQIYTGAWRLGVGLFLAVTLVMAVAIWATRHVPPTPTALAVFAIAVVLALAISIDAARRARRPYIRARPPWYRSTWLAVVVMVGISVGLSYANPMGWRSFSIASGSMMPGFMIGDRVMAGIQQTMPERGDVAVFLGPKPPLADYVKRVIGLPGDHVQLRHSIVYLNGQPLLREPSSPLSLPSAPAAKTFRGYRESLQGGRGYTVVEMSADGPGDNTEEYVVPAGHFFVLSDNRDDGVDSRHFGYVPLKNLIGVVRTMYWSRDPSKLLSHVE